MLFSTLVVSRSVVVSFSSVVVDVELEQAVSSAAAARNRKNTRMVKIFESGKVVLHQKIKKKS